MPSIAAEEGLIPAGLLIACYSSHSASYWMRKVDDPPKSGSSSAMALSDEPRADQGLASVTFIYGGRGSMKNSERNKRMPCRRSSRRGWVLNSSLPTCGELL